ncbi:MAG TPA: flagellar basal body protein [Candidatus Binatia bacterium]|nr:flagellar basal body protein [Candidatus Binatia bacterium]
MALLADDAKDRVEQLLLISERLTALIDAETQRIEARLPPLDGQEAEEKTRLANAYRLELARVKQDRALIEGAPPALLAQLRQSTVTMHEMLAAHETALNAVKLVAEGLVHAMADEVVRQRGGDANYGAKGELVAPNGLGAAVLDRSA